MAQLGRLLIIAGVVILIAGILLTLGGKIPFLGKLPGDITIKGKNYIVYIPIVTMILLSLIITIILKIFGRR
ncbi:DUF2905 domain-containing protein [bacterium]|nr:DUF2905 domain-containing protein [FCB group bacterium]MBL7190662.1 DUF2905 domain-containing protein [bacterium]